MSMSGWQMMHSLTRDAKVTRHELRAGTTRRRLPTAGDSPAAAVPGARSLAATSLPPMPVPA